MRSWDERHLARTGQPRAYHLVARLQMETAGRSVSVTERMTKDCLEGSDTLQLIGKGGRRVEVPVSRELYSAIAAYLDSAGVILAERNPYRAAWRRAVASAGGRATGTHGLRRLSTRGFYRAEYARLLAAGMSPREARQQARAAAIERLGHGRHREDQAACHLGNVA